MLSVLAAVQVSQLEFIEGGSSGFIYALWRHVEWHASGLANGGRRNRWDRFLWGRVFSFNANCRPRSFSFFFFLDRSWSSDLHPVIEVEISRLPGRLTVPNYHNGPGLGGHVAENSDAKHYETLVKHASICTFLSSGSLPGLEDQFTHFKKAKDKSKCVFTLD